MKKKLLHSIGLIFSVSLFAAALLIIHYELKEYRLKDILYHLDNIPAYSLFLAILLSILNYAVLTGYDSYAACAYIRRFCRRCNPFNLRGDTCPGKPS